MEDQFAEILAQCLDAVESGAASPAECANRYPELREDLQPLLETALRVANAPQVHPSAAFRRGARQRMVARLPQREPVTNRARLRPLWQNLRTKRSFAMNMILALLALVTVFSGAGAVYASGEALPGDVLYPLKLAVEDTYLALASDENDVQLYLDFAALRQDEIHALVTEQRFDDVPQAVQEYQGIVTQLNRVVHDVPSERLPDCVPRDAAPPPAADIVTDCVPIRDHLPDCWQVDWLGALPVDWYLNCLPANVPPSDRSDQPAIATLSDRSDPTDRSDISDYRHLVDCANDLVSDSRRLDCPTDRIPADLWACIRVAGSDVRIYDCLSIFFPPDVIRCIRDTNSPGWHVDVHACFRNADPPPSDRTDQMDESEPDTRDLPGDPPIDELYVRDVLLACANDLGPDRRPDNIQDCFPPGFASDRIAAALEAFMAHCFAAGRVDSPAQHPFTCLYDRPGAGPDVPADGTGEGPTHAND